MRLDRGTVWTEKQQATARQLLAGGYDRDVVAQRLGITRRSLTSAITRFKLMEAS